MSIYLKHWRLRENPFEHVPDDRFFYSSPEHAEALSRLAYAVSEKKPIALLSGEYGTGKTMVCHALGGRLPIDGFKLVHIVNPRLSMSEILAEMLRTLQEAAVAPTAKGEAFRAVKEVLIRCANVGKHVCVIVDEAHLIEDASLFDDLRMLLNYQHHRQMLVTLILAGQSELRDKVGRLPSFRQRITVQFHLKPMDEAEVEKYIQHRLKTAGHAAPGAVYRSECFPMIYQHSKGLPRIINNICDLALLSGYQRQAAAIDSEILADVLQEVSSYEEATAAF